jgi:DNA helicase-2/ATP-dependent DNA helicase PcrA
MGSGKTTRLLTEAAQLLNTHSSASVLILCSNHARQRRFIEGLLGRLTRPVGQLPVYTFAGLVRNTLFNYWPLVEEELGKTLKGLGQPVLTPQLSGLEDTEFILNRILDGFQQEHPRAFAEFPGNRRGLVKQLVRRIRLRSENGLSRPEMTRRSQLLEEMCQAEVAEIERRFDRMSYAIRVLDPNKQLDVFQRLVDTHPVLQADLIQTLKHLVVDDVDETIPAQQQFIERLAPTLDTLILAADIDGGSRRGYLNAYPYDWQRLKELRPGETVTFNRTDTVYTDAQTLLANWKRTDAFTPLGPTLAMIPSFLTQVEMLDHLVQDIYQHLSQGYTAGELAVVLPESDALLFYRLQNKLKQRGIRVQLLCGTRRPLDNPLCRGLIYLIQLANSQTWAYRLSPIEWRTILTHLLQLNRWSRQGVDQLVSAFAALQSAQPTADGEASALVILPPWEDPTGLFPPEARARYEHLLAWLEKAQRIPFEKQLFSAFSEIVAPYAATEEERFVELNRWVQSYERQKRIDEALNSLIPSPEASETALGGLSSFDRRWLAQVKTGSVADTPENPEEIDEQAVVVGSPQKIIDFEVRRRVQFWLDCGSRQWARSDNAPLYNAWVHSAVWDGSTAAFSEDFKEAIIRTRAAHITRTLMLLTTERVRAYESELDSEGFSHAGLMKPRLIGATAEELSEPPAPRAILRSDQAPILEYEQGTMAITAVPGAGKTFVNVELILTLIDRGVPPDQILVLTYMDSAAKTLLSRLKAKLPLSWTQGGRKLPTVCTIHSLAFRILTENDHSIALGYRAEDVDILDDQARAAVLAQVAAHTQPASTPNGTNWLRAVDRGIAYAKMQGITPEAIERQVKKMSQNFRLIEFLPAYQLYQQLLKENGQLDFTDLIWHAVTLLEGAPDIAAHYQNQFRILMEDEAQDSSRVLQQLIGLIGGSTPNLIRTGDPNQSITTTFSAADPAVFRQFIESADRTVRMDGSGRCAPEVMELANQLILAAEQHPILAGSFEPVAMQPVPGFNPSLLAPIETRLFETAQQEEAWLVEAIAQARQAHPEASIAVLVRRNEDVQYLAGCLQQANIPAISLSDTLNVHPVYAVLLGYMQLLESPGDLEKQVALYDAMAEAGITPADPVRRAFLAENSLFYQPLGVLRDEFLLQFYYDWLDFSRDAAGSNVCNLIIRITDRLFHTVGDRSNGYLCALWAQEILEQNRQWDDLSPLEIVTRQFEAYQKSKRRRRGFSEALSEGGHQFVQVMSMHKSKGQEFEIVFMPHLTSRMFRSQLNEVTFKEEEKLVQELDRVRLGGTLPPNYVEQTKTACIQEEARLLYVGVTRARQALYVSSHCQSLQFGKMRPVEPAWGFYTLQRLLNPDVTDAQDVAPEPVSSPS